MDEADAAGAFGHAASAERSPSQLDFSAQRDTLQLKSTRILF